MGLLLGSLGKQTSTVGGGGRNAAGERVAGKLEVI